MRTIFLLFFLAIGQIIYGQFDRVQVHSPFLTKHAVSKQAGDNELVMLLDGELYHLVYNEGQYEQSVVQNTIPSIRDFIMYDIDQDGDLDIIAYKYEANVAHTYLKENGEYVYSPAFNLFYGAFHQLHNQDYNDDGVEDLMINHGLYVTTGINERERVLRFPLINNYYYSMVYFLDYDEDGDKDIIHHQVNRLWILQNTGADVSTKQIKFPETDEVTEWSRVIKTNNGEQVIYYDRSRNQIRRLSFDSTEYEIDILLNIELDEINTDLRVIDVNSDGNEEIIVNSRSKQDVVILEYDDSGDSLKAHINNISGQRSDVLGLFKENGNDVIFLKGNGKVSRYILNPDFSMDLIETKEEVLDVYGVGLVDFDGDGYTDVVTNNRVRRYLGNGEFEGIQTFTKPATGGLWQDYDGDGDADYVSEYDWYEHESLFSFSDVNIIPDPDSNLYYQIFFTEELLWADVDQDGDDDLFTYNEFGEPLEIYENINHDTLIYYAELTDEDSISGDPVLARVIDTDLDGDLDLIFVVHSGAFLFKNEGGLNFSDPINIYSGDYTPLTAEVADVNYDGYPDLLLGTREIVTAVAVGETILYLGSENEFSTSLLHAGRGYHSAYVANLDNEGWLDVVMTHNDGLNYYVTDDGTSWSEILIDGILVDNSDLLIKDVDSDDDDDIIMYKDANPEAYFYINGGVGNGIEICPAGDVYCYNQRQVDRYKLNYGRCEVINGDLHVGSQDHNWTNIDDASAFQRIKHIKGDFDLDMNNLLEDLLGFQSLEKVDGAFSIIGYKSPSFDGVQNLEYVGGDFYFSNVGSAVSNESDLSEFEKLDTINGSVNIIGTYVTSLEPLLQPVFNGDFIIENALKLPDLTGFDQIDTIKGKLQISRTQISDLSPLDSIQYLGGLEIKENDLLLIFKSGHLLSHIEGDVIISRGNIVDFHIDGLNNLQSVGGKVSLSATKLSGFQQLRRIEENLTFIVDEISDGALSQLESVNGGLNILSFDGDDLSFLESLQTVKEYLYLQNNKISSLIGVHRIKDTLNEIQISSNVNLPSLDEIHDEITVLDEWSIFNNRSLNICSVPPLCRHISEGRAVDIFNNGFECNGISDVRCVDNSFSGFTFFDLNEDGVMQEGEAPLSNIHVTQNSTNHLVTSDDGYYRFNAAEGDSIYVGIDVPVDWHITTPDHVIVDSFEVGNPNNYGNNFGLYPDFTRSEIQYSLTSGIFLCDRVSTIYIEVSNTGTNSESGYVEIQYPEHVQLDTGFVDYSDHDEINRILRFDYELTPYFNRQIRVPFQAPPATFIGEEFITNIGIYRDDNGSPALVGEETISYELLCSYDPNDKMVLGSRGTNDFQFDSNDPLTYTVRFQNTGNFFAEDVRIRDTISELLDLSTFEFLQSSHPVEIQMEGRVIAFIFEGINLPDSVRDYEGSQGFVMFRIHPVSNVIIGDQIDNDAHIYFDYNDAIITNLVRTLVDDLTGIIDYANLEKISVYPNPTSNLLYVDEQSLDLKGQVNYNVIGLNGQRIMSGAYDNNIDMSNVAAGMYIVVIENQGKYFYSRIVVE